MNDFVCLLYQGEGWKERKRGKGGCWMEKVGKS